MSNKVDKSKKINNKNEHQSGGWGWIAVLLILVIAIGAPIYLSNKNNWVLKVNEEKVTKQEYKYFFYSYVSQFESENSIDPNDSAAQRAFWDSKNEDGERYEDLLRKMTIDTMKEYKSFASLGREKGLEITSEEKEYFKKQIEDMIINNFSNKRIEADKALKEYYGIDTNEYYNINLQLYFAYEKSLRKVQSDEFAKQKDLVTQEEIGNKYNEDPKAYDTVTVRHILFKTVNDNGESLGTDVKEQMKLKAEEIAERIKNNEDMIALAKQYSQDTSVINNEGVFKYNKAQVYNADSDTWGQNTLVPEFSNWGINAELNEVGIVETTFGYHVMRLEARETKTEEDAKTIIIDELAADKVSDSIEAILANSKYEPIINTKVIEKIRPIM